MKTLGCVLGVAVVVGGLGCGGGGLGTGGDCGKVQPCGGSVVGAWKVESACIIDTSLLAGDATDICPTATVTLKSFTVSGTQTFNADLTYVSTGTEQIDLTVTVPSSCFTAGATCADVNTSLAQQMQQDPTLKSASCSMSGGACVCEVDTAMDAGDSGTYMTTGTTLTGTSASGDPSEDSDDQYCVQGNELHDIAVDMSMTMGSMGVVKIEGDVVFTKQ